MAQLHALGVPTPPLREGLSAQGARIAAEASRLAGREAARRGHGREAYTSLVLPLPQAGLLQREKQWPRRPRKPRLLSFHLADPSLP